MRIVCIEKVNMLLPYPIARALSFENDPPSILTKKVAEDHRVRRKRSFMSPTFAIAEGEGHNPSTTLESLNPTQVKSAYTFLGCVADSTIHFMELPGLHKQMYELRGLLKSTTR